MKNHRINIADEIDETTKMLLEDYWHIDNGKFSNRAKDILVKYGLTQATMNKLVKENSYCDILLEKCIDCGIDRKVQIYSQSAFNSPDYEISGRCGDCTEKFKRKRDKEEMWRIAREKSLKMSNAINQKIWLTLSEFELEILKKIIVSYDTNEAFSYVFDGNIRNKFIWRAVNKIEKLGLINVERTNGGKSLEFQYDPRLKNEIKGNFEKKTVTYLSFSLSKKTNKITSRQPNYSGTFTLRNDILLKAGEKYLYGGWIQTDESINLKFTPLKDIDPGADQTEIENEPKLVGNIIKDLFDDLKFKESYGEHIPF